MPQELFPLGSVGMRVPRIGVGIMSAAFYGSGDIAEDERSQLAALDHLVALCAPNPAFVDTAWIYAHPTGLHSESLVGKAVAKHGREKFIVATKFGSRGAAGPPSSATDVIHAQYAESIARLGTTPDLYYQHRPDPTRDIAEVMLDLKEMLERGAFKFIGLSECTADELRRAHAVSPITAIQVEYSLAERGIEAELLPAARELGVGIVAYSPLSRGLLTGAFSGTAALDAGDRRRHMPRLAGDAGDANVVKVSALQRLATEKGVTPAQLALAWLLSRGDDVFPIPGSKTPARIEENLGAVAVAGTLSAEDLAALSALDLSAVGARYPAAAMAHTWEARQRQQ